MTQKKGDCDGHPKPEFQGTVTVGEKGQIVIPAETRKALGLEKGTHLLTFKVGDVIINAKLESLEKIASQSSGKAAIIRELLETIH